MSSSSSTPPEKNIENGKKMAQMARNLGRDVKYLFSQVEIINDLTKEIMNSKNEEDLYERKLLHKKWKYHMAKYNNTLARCRDLYGVSDETGLPVKLADKSLLVPIDFREEHEDFIKDLKDRLEKQGNKPWDTYTMFDFFKIVKSKILENGADMKYLHTYHRNLGKIGCDEYEEGMNNLKKENEEIGRIVHNYFRKIAKTNAEKYREARLLSMENHIINANNQPFP